MCSPAQAQQLVQVEAAKAQEELANTVIEGYSSDETVRLQANTPAETFPVDRAHCQLFIR
jgi:DNA-binding protein YbaB